MAASPCWPDAVGALSLGPMRCLYLPIVEFKGSYFEREMILWALRWYVAYPISNRQLEEITQEGVGHT
jgi:hypothetical protein